MKVHTVHSAAKALAKALHKPVLLLHFGDDTFKDIKLAAPYLDLEDDYTCQAIISGTMVIVCESDRERDHLFKQTVGDDGPTLLNSYNGNTTVYALTISATGRVLNENT